MTSITVLRNFLTTNPCTWTSQIVRHRIRDNRYTAPFLLAGLLLVLSGVASADARNRTSQVLIDGKFDIGGYSLYLSCIGAGAPTVLIDAGVGLGAAAYQHLQTPVADLTSVCIYDRAGLGLSDAGPSPRTSEQMAKELKSLLDVAGVGAPYILVGHSLGGYNARIFQAKHPELVAALVLVDSGHEDQWDELPQIVSNVLKDVSQMMRLEADRAEKGEITRESIDSTIPDQLPANLREQLLSVGMTPKPYNAAANEFDSVYVSAKQVPEQLGPGDIPLIVLTARDSFDAYESMGIPFEPSNEIWMSLQKRLTALSPSSIHRFSDGTHWLIDSHPEDVISSIALALELVEFNAIHD